MNEFERVKNEFDTWTIGLSASRARNTPLSGNDEPLAVPLDVRSSEAVGTFLKQHPKREVYRAELLEYAKQSRSATNGIYWMNLELWEKVVKSVAG